MIINEYVIFNCVLTLTAHESLIIILVMYSGSLSIITFARNKSKMIVYHFSVILVATKSQIINIYYYCYESHDLRTPYSGSRKLAPVIVIFPIKCWYMNEPEWGFLDRLIQCGGTFYCPLKCCVFTLYLCRGITFQRDPCAAPQGLCKSWTGLSEVFTEAKELVTLQIETLLYNSNFFVIFRKVCHHESTISTIMNSVLNLQQQYIND